MAEQPGQESKAAGQETIFNSEIGDDWGEAFESEDFMALSSEEASAEFFLPDEPSDTATLNIPIAGDVPPSAAIVSPPGTISTLEGADSRRSLFSRLQTIPRWLTSLLVALPLVALLAFWLLRTKALPPEVVTPDGQLATVAPLEHPQQGPASPPVAPPPLAVEEPPAPQHSPPPVSGEQAQAGLVSPPEAPAEAHVAPHPSADSAEAPPPAGRELRKKWQFPAIIVHAKTEPGAAPVVLSMDLTLVVKLPPEVMPPAGREAFIREIFYQFYFNQPVENLRRYAIDRGEMSRSLRAWIVKQWPDLPLDAIVIDRYQLL